MILFYSKYNICKQTQNQKQKHTKKGMAQIDQEIVVHKFAWKKFVQQANLNFRIIWARFTY